MGGLHTLLKEKNIFEKYITFVGEVSAASPCRISAEAPQWVIINISSIHDKVPRKGLVHYCSAKAALNMMTKCLTLELAEHNIRVIAVSPGAIETEMNREEINKFGREKFNGWIPLGKIGVVDDVAWACAFFASDKAAYITATELYIDGGYKESPIPYDPRPKTNQWHNIAMDTDAEVIIVEKSNTHLGVFMYRNCTFKEQEYLRNAIQTLVQQ